MSVLSQRSLAGGELTPSLQRRADVQKFVSAMRTMRNFQIMKQGGARTRCGFYHLCPVKDHSKKVRVIPFIYGTAALDNFVLEFGEGYIRFINSGYYPVLENNQDIVSITDANPGVFEVTGHGFANGEDVVLDGSFPTGMRLELIGPSRRFRIRDATADTFTLEYLDGPSVGTKVNTTPWDLSGYVAADAVVARVYTLTSPYQESELFSLDFRQSGSTLFIVHPSHAPRELAWNGVTWTLSTTTTAPSNAAPTGLAASGAGGAGPARSYKVTSVASETYEESLATASVNATAANSLLSWNAVAGSAEYNIYGYGPQGWGLMAIADTNSWTIDATIEPDISDTFPVARTPFNASGKYPSAVGFVQQRLAYSASDNEPEKNWLSRTGFYRNFSIRSPIQEDDAVTFIVAGGRRSKVMHILELGKRPVYLTEENEQICDGAGGGIITPFAINPRADSHWGASKVMPVVIGQEALYVQAQASIIRNIGHSFEVDGVAGNDITIFSSHLFRDYTVIEMAYQKNPDSTVWVVRSDGILLGLTYVREHQMFGWHRHDTDGFFESVCTAPFGADDVVYAAVKRTIDGQTVRYIEAMESVATKRQFGMDGTSGRGAINSVTDFLSTITLTGGVNWDENETLTATVTNLFGGGLVHEEDALYRGLVILHPTHGMVRLAIEGWTNSNVFTVRPDRTVPAAYRAVSTGTVSETAVYLSTKRIEGLWHLEGESVAVVAGERTFKKNKVTRVYENIAADVVVASPNNSAYEILTVTNGVVDLARHVVHPRVGLPYLCDLETLNVDSARDTTVGKKMLVSAVTLTVEDSRGIWTGARPPTDDETSPLQGLTEAKLRHLEGYDRSVDLMTGDVEIRIDSHWNSNGRVFVRQVDPQEMTVLAISPHLTLAAGR